MRKRFYFSCFLFLLAGKAFAVPITSEELIREGQIQLCKLFDRNDAAIANGHPEEMEFVVQVSGEETVDYISSVTTANHSPEAAGQSPEKDSINAKLRRAYNDFGVELYIVLINSLDVVVSAPLPEDFTVSQLFTQKLYDDRTNMAAMRAEHRRITDEIINTSISGRNRDCIVLSQCTYCGSFFKNDGQGCLQFAKIYGWRAQPSTYDGITFLTKDFTNRLKSSNSFMQGNGTYSMPAAADAFYEAASYEKLKANLLHTYTPDSISAILDQFQPSTDYAGLTFAEREHILAVYSGYVMTGDWFLNGTGEEGYVLRVIAATPSEEVPGLLNMLSAPSILRNNPNYNGQKDSKALIVHIIEETDDAVMMADDNYTALLRTITLLMTENAEVLNAHLPTDDAGWHNRSIYWYDTYVFSTAPIGAHSYDVTMSDDGSVTVEKEIVDYWTVDYYNTAATPNYTAHWDDNYPPETFQPFDLVFFTNRGSISLLQEAGASPEAVHIAPAIFLKYADDKQFNENISNGLKLLGNIIGTGAGPGLIMKALEAGLLARAAFEAMQFISYAGALAAGLINDPELQSLVDKYNTIVGIWGLSRLTLSAGKFTVNFLTEAKAGNLKQIAPSVAEDFRQSFAQAESKLGQLDEATKTKLVKMEEYLGEAVEVANFDIESIAPLLHTEPNKAFFWSGKTDGIGGAEIALQIAQERGGTTLEGLIEAHQIQMPLWDINNPSSIKVWEDVSAEYARQVSGEVFAVVGTQLREGNIWETVELPRLMGNHNVTKITKIDPVTKIETVIFTR